MSGRSRLEAMFDAGIAGDRAVLLPYLTAGLPDRNSSVELFVAMADAGADGFEVGIPYADPLMDGPVIMEAGERALAQGVTVEVALGIITDVVEATGKPVLAMTYVNPVLRHGIDEFMRRLAATGAGGVILADLPVDESVPFSDAAASHGLGLVQFAAPTTGPDRMDRIAARDPVFVYGIAEIGVTGERTDASRNLETVAARVRAATSAPLVFGVGISTPEQAAAAAKVGDGVIVGTAIVRRVIESPDGEAAIGRVTALVEELARSMRRD